MIWLNLEYYGSIDTYVGSESSNWIWLIFETADTISIRNGGRYGMGFRVTYIVYYTTEVIKDLVYILTSSKCKAFVRGSSSKCNYALLFFEMDL